MGLQAWQRHFAFLEGTLEPLEYVQARPEVRIAEIVVEAQIRDLALAQYVDRVFGRAREHPAVGRRPLIIEVELHGLRQLRRISPWSRRTDKRILRR